MSVSFRSTSRTQTCTPHIHTHILVYLAYTHLSTSRTHTHTPVLRRGWREGLAAGTDVLVLPGLTAAAAEDGVAGLTGQGGRHALYPGHHAAHSLAVDHRAPRLTGIQLHLWRKRRHQNKTMSGCTVCRYAMGSVGVLLLTGSARP